MNKNRIYKIKVNFQKNILIYPSIELVKEDYNSVEFDFEFDVENGTKVLEIKKPDGKVWIKEIVDNKVVLADINSSGEVITLINQKGTYKFEIVLYSNNSKLTINDIGEFTARDEVVTSDDEQVKSNSGLPILDDLINKVETQKKELSAAIEDSTTATNEAVKTTEEMENLKTEVENKASNGSFNGATFIPTVDEDGNISWSNDKNLANPDTVNIMGPQGPQGIQGEAFKIKKTYSNKQAMINDFSNMDIGDYVMITSNIEVEDNAKLYCRGEEEWIYITDFSGATGIQGPQGPQGIQGIQGIQGPKPVKGVDYFTEAEKSEMVQEIIVDSNNAFNENVEAKTNEYNENHEAKIQEYNENTNSVIDIIDHLIPKSEVSGNMVQIVDSLDYKVLETKLSGNYEQKKYDGQQLYDVKDVYTFSDIISVDGDDWITVSYDNSAGTTTKWFDVKTNLNNLIKENTTYKLIVEIKKISGTGNVWFASGQVGAQVNSYSGGMLNALKVGTTIYDLTTKSDFTGLNNFLNTYGSFTAGQSGSITFRMSVIENTTITTESFIYEPFVGGYVSPNPDYPQEIDMVEYYNLFDKDNANILDAYPSRESHTILENPDAKMIYIPIEPNTTYTISRQILASYFAVAYSNKFPKYNIPFYGLIRANTAKSITITTGSEAKYLIVRYYYAPDKYTSEELLDGLQIVKGKKIKPYLPYRKIAFKKIKKNFLKNELVSQIVEGVEFTVNADKTITANGTATAGISLNLWDYSLVPPGEYILSDGLSNPTNSTYFLYADTRDENGNATPDLNLSTTAESTAKRYFTDEWQFNPRIVIREGQTLNNVVFKPMLRLANVSDNFYEEYHEQIVYLDLQDNFIGKLPNGAKNELIVDNLGNVTLFERIRKGVLDGTENWNINSETDDYFECVCNINEKAASIYTLSNYFSNTNNCRIIILNGYIYLRYPKKSNIDVSSLDKFKKFLTENNVIFYYELLSENTISLGKLDELIQTKSGINNIYPIVNLETEISVKYALDIKKYIDNQNAIQDTKVSEIETLIATPSTASMLMENYASDLESEV